MSQLGVFRLALILGTGALAAACAGPPAPVAPTIAPATTAAKQIYVVVERGQSLDQIARTYGAAKEDIIAANHLKQPYKLKPGTVLVIPAGAAPPSKEGTPSKTPASATLKPDQPAEAPAPSRQTRPKRPPPEVIPLD